MREGRAAFEGTYKELLISGLDLAALLPTEGGERGDVGAATMTAIGDGETKAKAGGTPQLDTAKDSKLMNVEERVTGTVHRRIWSRYFRVAGYALMAVPVVLGACAQFSKVATSPRGDSKA